MKALPAVQARNANLSAECGGIMFIMSAKSAKLKGVFMRVKEKGVFGDLLF